MDFLDMRTIVFSYVITDIICVWFVVLLWRQNRNRFAGTAFWAIDFVLQVRGLNNGLFQNGGVFPKTFQVSHFDSGR